MSTINVNKGSAVLSLSSTAIAITYTAGDSFQAGSAGVIGLQFWATITTKVASAVTQVTFAVETSNDGTNWAPTLAIPHVGAGTQDVEPAFAGLAAATTVVKRITVLPQYVGAAKYVRLKAKADGAGAVGDSISVLATAW